MPATPDAKAGVFAAQLAREGATLGRDFHIAQPDIPFARTRYRLRSVQTVAAVSRPATTANAVTFFEMA